jgi:hypothetical protein
MKITGSLLVSGGLFPQVYSPTSSLTPSATVSVNFTSASIFELTPNANTMLNLTEVQVGVNRTIIVTGAGGGYTLQLNVEGESGTFNKISGNYNDAGSTKNFINIQSVAPKEFWYTIAQPI